MIISRQGQKVGNDSASLAVEATSDRVNLDALRAKVQSQHQNIGVVAAFMAALAGQAYFGAVTDRPRCLGEDAVAWQIAIQWFTMGMFFAAINSSILMLMDLAGVPDGLLVRHMESSAAQCTHALPAACTLVGTIALAMGYAIDLGERLGCRYSVAGFVCAPLFAGFTVALGLFMRRTRRQLFMRHMPPAATPTPCLLGRAYINTWHDKIQFERRMPS